MKRIVFFFCVLSMSFNAWASDIVVAQTEKEKYKYRIELANLILEKTSSEYGHAEVVPYSGMDPSQQRAINLLSANKIDLMYLPPTEERLAGFDSIKIDIHHGMLGFRVFIIRKSDQERFAKIKTIDDLRGFKGGFGSQWGDFKVFGLNHLPVVGTANTHTLLRMLNARRFDYFHRGLHEAWAEVEANKHKFPDLTVDKNIALVYDLPVYFMFNKNNEVLKERFEKGFKIIRADGSFKKLFYANFNDIVEKADIKNRTLIRIKYPTPKGLAPIDTSLWL